MAPSTALSPAVALSFSAARWRAPIRRPTSNASNDPRNNNTAVASANKINMGFIYPEPLVRPDHLAVIVSALLAASAGARHGEEQMAPRRGIAITGTLQIDSLTRSRFIRHAVA